MSFTPTVDMNSEITFITGVTASGAVAGTSFWTWNEDTPATYSSTESYAAKWGSATAGTSGGAVTYSFDAASNWTPTEQAAFAETYALWAAVANVTFQVVTPGSSADVVISRSSSGNSNGGITNLYEGRIGSTHIGQAISAGISINTSSYAEGPLGSSFSNFGGYPWQTLLHEEGHTLGLGHAGAYDGTVNSATSQYGLYDAREWSIMSYIDPSDTMQAQYSSEPVSASDWGISASTDGTYTDNVATTWMPIDILAIQRLYGLPVTTPLSGGQTFGFDSNIVGPIAPFFDFTQNTKPIITLWDEGGGNTLDLSGYAMTETVDLHPGVFSSIGGLTHNVVIAFGVAINTVIGGTGSDTLIANDQGDHIVGGLGDDVIVSGLGADILDGGAGSNRFEGTKAELNGDTAIDFNFGDSVWITDGSMSDNFALSGNQLSWGAGSLILARGLTGALVVTADSGGGVDISLSGGYASASAIAGGELVTGTTGNYVSSQTVYSAIGYELYSNDYSSTGQLTEQFGFASNGVLTAELDHFADGSSFDTYWTSQGVLSSQAGYTGQGLEAYANIYDPTTGRLIEQLGFSNGVTTAKIDHAADGSSFETTFYGSGAGAGAVATLEQFDTNGEPVWKNSYSTNGQLLEQDGFASNGVRIIEIDRSQLSNIYTTSWTSAGIIQSQVQTDLSGNLRQVVIYDLYGREVESDSYSSTTHIKLTEYDYAVDGSSTAKAFGTNGGLTNQTGYSASYAKTYANHYDASAFLYQQDGYTDGVKTYELDHATDGTSVVKLFGLTGILQSLAGYSGTGVETYANLYDSSGRLTAQQGFDASGLKTTEIDHFADGTSATSQFTQAGLIHEVFYDIGANVTETLTRVPSTGLYTLTGSVGQIVLAAINGTGTLTAGGGGTTFSFASAFGSATVTNFVASGSGQDLIRVDSHLAADFTHLMADAQNVNGDVVFTFDANDHLTLHGVQISQLGSNDFAFF